MNAPYEPEKRPGRHLKHWIKAEPLCALYIKLNEALFDSVLPDIPCYINPKLSRCLGRCLYYRDGDISVPYAIDFSPMSLIDDFFDTFIHEMVHVWQGAVGRQPNHDRIFHICLQKKKEIFKAKCDSGELSDKLPEMVTNMYPALPNRSTPPPASKKAFPWTGWSVNLKYSAAFDEVNQKHFDGLLPSIPIYQNPRLKRSICRFHMQYVEGGLEIVAGDVKPNVGQSRLKLSFYNLLPRCMYDMLSQNRTISPTFQPAIEHLRSLHSKKP